MNRQSQFNKPPTFGEKCADNVAKFGGSWPFLGWLFVFLAAWIALNMILDKFGLAW